MPRHRSDAGAPVNVIRRRDLDKASLKRILDHCPAGEASKLGYVIIAGVEGERLRGTRRPVLAYSDSRAAFVVPRSPLVLCARGEVGLLHEEGIYFIPSSKRRLRFLNAAAAVAVVLLGLAAGLLFVLKGEDGPSPELTQRMTRILEEGYQGIHELPGRYLSILPDAAGRLQYADTGEGGEDDFQSRLDASINVLIANLGSSARNDRKLLGFLDSIVKDDRFTRQTRRAALQKLFSLAKYQGIPELILLYRGHPAPFIRSDADRLFSLNRSEVEKQVDGTGN
jgi:hypothetical protein